MSLRSLHRLSALVALATVGLGSFALAATADARTAPAKPTVILVHGAFADASGFAAVIDQLRDDGYPVRAAPTACSVCSPMPRPSAVSLTASRGRRSSSVTPTAAL
jgi:hypothetical protein